MDQSLSYRPGQAPGVSLLGTRVDFLLTAENSNECSVFEFHIVPGFDTGAHYHTKIEETFYVLEGRLELRIGDHILDAPPGTFVLVPVGAVHSFSNRSTQSARMLLTAAPGGHEKYFQELAALVAAGPPDPNALAALRRKYDTVQVQAITTT